MDRMWRNSSFAWECLLPTLRLTKMWESLRKNGWHWSLKTCDFWLHLRQGWWPVLGLPFTVTSTSWPSLASGKGLRGQPDPLSSVTMTPWGPSWSQWPNAIWWWSHRSYFTHLSNRLRTILNNIQRKALVFTTWYCMASSMNGQDKPNPAWWLATQAAKTVLSCPLCRTLLTTLCLSL